MTEARLTEHHWKALSADVQARIGYSDYGIDPISMMTLLTTIIPAIIGWVQECKRLKDEDVQPSVASMYKQNPSLTISRLSSRCKLERKRQGQQFCDDMRLRGALKRDAMKDFILSDEDATSMAQGMIDECLSQTPEGFARYCRGV